MRHSTACEIQKGTEQNKSWNENQKTTETTSPRGLTQQFGTHALLPESHSFHGTSALPLLALGSGSSFFDVTTASAQCLALMAPRRHTRPKRRIAHCAITPLACSDPWQHPKRSGFFDPVSAISFRKVDVARLTSPNAPTEMHMTCFMEASWVSTWPGEVSGVVSLKAASVSLARARYWPGAVAAFSSTTERRPK